MPGVLVRRVRTRQPQNPTGIDYKNPVGDRTWNCVHVPGIMLFGKTNPQVLSLGVNTTYATSRRGRCVYQSGFAANAGLNYGTNSGFDLSVSSGIIEGEYIDNGGCPLFRTGTGTYKNGDFYVDISAGAARLVKANVVVIVASSNTIALGSSFVLAWSYNNSTGRAVIALNGVITTATSAQTFDHTGDAVIVGYDQSSATSTYPAKLSLLAISPTEILNNEITRKASVNPWQIFEPEVIPLFWASITAQFLRPISDIGNSGWTPSSGSDLFPMIGETVRNDATYISATEAGAWCEVLLGTSGGDPLSSINHLPRIVMSAGSGGIIIRIKQGATLIKEWTYASLPGTDTLYEPTLTGGEIDSITDYTDLRLYLETTA